MEITSGVIQEVHPDGLIVWVPYSNIERLCTREYKEVEVGLPDSRRISPEQRRKAYALMNEIADAVGYEPEEVKHLMKHEFITFHLKQMEKELFSLSDCDVTTAKEFITFLIDFILEFDIPTNEPLQNLADDIDRYVYSCLIHKKCAVCGQKAELHHVDAVGMGNNRNEVQHIGRRCLPLCRNHHMEIHSTGTDAFLDKYHLKPGTIDEKIVKVYRLRGKAKDEK